MARDIGYGRGWTYMSAFAALLAAVFVWPELLWVCESVLDRGGWLDMDDSRLLEKSRDNVPAEARCQS